MSRDVQTEIHVDHDGHWCNGESRIINDGILSFFRANLYRWADDRYFIFNEFRGMSEKGWLRAVKGFPLQATSVEIDTSDDLLLITLDNGVVIKRSPDQVFISEADQESAQVWTYLQIEEQPALHGKKPIALRLLPKASSPLYECMEYEAGNLVLQLSNKHRLELRHPDF